MPRLPSHAAGAGVTVYTQVQAVAALGGVLLIILAVALAIGAGTTAARLRRAARTSGQYLAVAACWGVLCCAMVLAVAGAVLLALVVDP